MQIMKKLLFILTLVLTAWLPVGLWAQSTTGGDDGSDAVAAPTFRFDGDYLVIETVTEDASIFYQMADLPDMSDETIEKVSSSMTVTANIEQSNYYEKPIELKKSVVLKAIAAGATESEVSVLVYDYDSWHKLFEAIEYGEKIQSLAQDNANVDEDLKEQLKWILYESMHFYEERAMMPYQEAQHFTNHIFEICAQIEQQMGGQTTAEPYAVLSENNTVLTFYYDDQKAARNGMSVGPFDGNPDYQAWYDQRESITSVVFDASFANCTTITSTAYWFYGCEKLTTITGISNLKTGNVTDMGCMFYGCANLASLDVSHFDTSLVEGMYFMFAKCSKLTNLDLSNFNTSNVKKMHYMFWDCSALQSIALSNFNTSNVIWMHLMFDGCSNLTSLDVSNFDTSNVTEIEAMFDGCSNLTSLDVSHFNTSKAKYMGAMFNDCRKLKSIDVSHFDTSNAESMLQMFAGCYSLTSLDVSNFNTAKVTNMKNMFSGCSNLVDINMSNFNTDNVTDMTDIFANCTSLASIQAGSAMIPANEYAKVENPNLLVYVNNEQYAPENIQNVVIGDFAKNIVLTDVGEGNGNFYCAQEFKAETITYSHEYNQTTEIDVARGWESIALPFTVQTITHETKGQIAPFGSTASGKHFWLRQLTENGLARATEIEPNTAYLISMPNNDAYYADFNLNGLVTFSSVDVWVPKTQIHAVDYHTEKGMVVLLPNFQRRASDYTTYALNVGEQRGDYPEGSVFEREYRDIRPFEAYTFHQGGSAPRFLPISDLNGDDATGIEEVRNLMAEGRGDVWFDMSGRRLQQKPAGKGVYILNGRKVVIK